MDVPKSVVIIANLPGDLSSATVLQIKRDGWRLVLEGPDSERANVEALIDLAKGRGPGDESSITLVATRGDPRPDKK